MKVQKRNKPLSLCIIHDILIPPIRSPIDPTSPYESLDAIAEILMCPTL